MITGFHTIIYSDDAEATRAFFRDVLGWPSVDAGGGWLIFKTPPAEMGVHPTLSESGERWATIPHAQLSVMCDDLGATIAELQSQGRRGRRGGRATRGSGSSPRSRYPAPAR